MDRGRPPRLAGRAGDALFVKPHGDGARRCAGGILVEDAGDDSGLAGIDLARAAHEFAVLEIVHHVIAVGIAAARPAVLDTAAQAAPRLVGQVFQEHGIHRALEADMKLRDLAFRQGENSDAGKAQALVDARNVFLIAREAVERLRQHDVEPAFAGVGQERLHAGAHERGAGEAVIGVAFDDGPAFAGGAFRAQTDLIFD